MMNKQDLSRRLSVAIADAKDADRVWLLATAQHERVDSEDLDARRRLDALWQERERAHHRVVELRWAASRQQRSSGDLAQRLRSARRTLSLVGYRVSGRSL